MSKISNIKKLLIKAIYTMLYIMILHIYWANLYGIQKQSSDIKTELKILKNTVKVKNLARVEELYSRIILIGARK